MFVFTIEDTESTDVKAYKVCIYSFLYALCALCSYNKIILDNGSLNKALS